MLLVQQNNSRDDLLGENEISSQVYQNRFDQHQRNACAYVKQTGLVYDAICLAQNKNINRWAWHYAHSEGHPAIVTLCAFWDCYQTENSLHEARIPYIQLFFGQENYCSLIPSGIEIPLKVKDEKTQHHLKMASVLFGQHFLVTYLAGRHITARQSNKNYLIHHSVHDIPLFKEPLVFGAKNLLAFDHQNNLAWQTLKALHNFPKRFPKIWQQLKQQHEVKHNEIH
ncbi:MAG: hypothetical protein KIT27_00530 [Legionellales bacterium]|nr:hypothetical protein [Legionellales bacterium]